MKSKPLIAIFIALALTACEQKKAPTKIEFPLIEKTAKDATQSDSIRESAGIFLSILSEKQGIPRQKMLGSHWEMMRSNSATRIATYVEFLKALEKKIPDQLPQAETYQAMEDKAGQATFIEYNVAQTVLMMSNSIYDITIYGDPGADTEVEGVLKRLKEKHGASETGKKILEFLNMVHEQGLQARSWGIKPWESPRKPAGNID